MRQEDGRFNWIIRRMMMVIGVILIGLLTLKGLWESGWGIQGEKLKNLVENQADQGLFFVWELNYPAAMWQEDRVRKEDGTEESVGAGLLDMIIRRLPVVRYLTGRETEEYGYVEADPAYAEYLETGKFYEEHQYLLYDGGEESGAGIGEEGETELASENQSDVGTSTVSAGLPVLGIMYQKEQLADFDFLMKHFYSVHTSTTAGRDLIKADEFLARDFTLEGGNENPQILIYHSHSQETFADYGPDRTEATVMGIGNYLTELLTQKGYNVIHDTSVYDVKDGKLDRNKAYTYALDGITGILQNNPSVEVVLDLHRDGVKESLHMVNEVNGKPTAPIMFFNGVSQTPEGPIAYLNNPYRADNLAFSFQMQLDAAAYFPGLTRKIYLKGLRYNLHLRARSALIEVGAQTNTYEEARNAMEPLAELLDMVLQGN